MNSLNNTIRKTSMQVLALCLLTFTSCSSFLDEEPSNASNASESIATTADAQVAINGIMSLMSSSTYYGRNFLLYGDAKGGDMTIYANGRGNDALYTFNHTPTSGSYSGFWSRGYYCIMQANNLLENIDRLQADGSTAFNYYKGEALSLRALFYFDLVRLYGQPYNYNKSALGVPLVLNTLAADAQPHRATVEAVYKQIISDLTEGQQLMASDKSVHNGYLDYYGNVALQARVRLYMEDYAGALAAAREVIESGKYTLYTPQQWTASWARQYGSESIFELGIDTETDLGTTSLGFYYMRYNQKRNAMGWYLASDYFLNRLGEDTTDVRWGVMDNDEYWVETGNERRGACYKYLGGLSMEGDGKESYTAVNIKIIRLSEVYLIAAEAALHTGDPAAAAEYLNAIRCRAPKFAPATAATVSDDMILDERSKELYGEGQRFFDMIRMNKTIEYNDDFQNVPVTHRSKTIDRTYGGIVLPISQDEINANPSLEDEQNDYYK